MKSITQILSIPSDLGAQRYGTSLALDALLVAADEANDTLFKKYALHIGPQKTSTRGIVGPYKAGKYAEALSELNQNTAAFISKQMMEGTPLVISGDHSNAIGIMAGVKEVIGADKKLGVLWIDAHADLHTPYTTPSGNLHGMSLAASMGFDNIDLGRNEIEEGLKKEWGSLKQCGAHKYTPKINPTDVCFIGLRDFEIQEYQLLKDYQLKHYSPYDIKHKSLAVILEEVKNYFSDYDAVYVSFDVDVLDTSVSTGTGTPVYNGLLLEDAKFLVQQLKQMDNIILWEFTEINPLLDNNNSMSKAVYELCKVLLG
jgi:arginase